FSEALAQHPKIFNRLFVSMVKAGELGGVLEVVLKRPRRILEKAQKTHGKGIAAMFYPVAVMTVAVIILAVLMIFVVPKFKTIFGDMMDGADLPAFTNFVLQISEGIKNYTIVFPEWAGGFPMPGPVILGLIALVIAFKFFSKTRFGRRVLDKIKLRMPVLGPVFTKVAISR